MSTKAKPRLHLIKPIDDRLAYDAQLDWYYNAYDSVAGLHSIPLSAPIEKHRGSVKPQARWREPSVYHPSPPQLSDFGKARKVWQRLQRLSWTDQTVLAEWYTPRQSYEREHKWHPSKRPDGGVPTEVREAHERWLRG